MNKFKFPLIPTFSSNVPFFFPDDRESKFLRRSMFRWKFKGTFSYDYLIRNLFKKR